MADPCSVPPEVLVPATNQTLELALGTRVALNCTVRWAGTGQCQHSPAWSKDGQWLSSGSSQDMVWFAPNASEQLLSSVLQLNLTHDSDFGVFACWVSNATATFTLRRAAVAGHVPAVLASLLVLALLMLVAGLYVRCRLNVLLWYRNRYGEMEINDGKLYDAYVSHTSAPDDHKFVQFILKPQLENLYGYKLFLDEDTILPHGGGSSPIWGRASPTASPHSLTPEQPHVGPEPSAELVMTMSRCRRLIVVLSVAYLEQDWCNHSFREGLWRLLELTSRPIFIVFNGRYREIQHPAINHLRQHRGTVTLLLWREGSMTPSSDFWKELCLALPRRVSLPGPVGDPQTRLQGDKDPMLTLSSSYGDSGSDLHPDGDLALQDCMFRPPPPRLAPAAAAGMEQPQLRDAQGPEIQDSDLGSRNYSVRSDYYCLVMGDV